MLCSAAWVAACRLSLRSSVWQSACHLCAAFCAVLLQAEMLNSLSLLFLCSFSFFSWLLLVESCCGCFCFGAVGLSYLDCLLTLLQFSCNLSGGKPTLSSELVITVNSQNLEQNYQLVSFPDIKHAEDSKDEMTGNQDTVASCHMPASVQGGSLSSPPMTHVDCSAPSISDSSVGKPTGARSYLHCNRISFRGLKHFLTRLTRFDN
ncbi:hypothetical protein Q3G72_004926 [Acer saccharum]|nr:hypothetical protein Q3G72_004926 [Acer saccharum]